MSILLRRRGVDSLLQNPLPVAAYAFDEGSGSTSADATGNGHTATVYGWTTSGHTNDAALGDASHISASYSGATLASAKTNTIMCWAYPLEQGTLFYAGFDDGSTGYMGTYWSDPTHLMLDVGNTAGTEFSQVSSVTTPLNAWIHVAVVWSGTTAALFLNGVSRATKATTGTITDINFWEAGGDIDNPGSGNSGQARIDDVRIFDKALTAAQITALMNVPV